MLWKSILPLSLAATAATAATAAAAPQPASDAVRARAPTPTTLQAGQYWIRAVESPNFHKYLQTVPANTPGVATLNNHTTAGQYNIVGGQLVEYTGNDSAPLYLNVARPANLTNPPRTLATTFNATENSFGTFAFQGDAVTWSTPDFQRQNVAAWLVCANQSLWINTGAYGYQTPSGCVDETVSANDLVRQMLDGGSRSAGDTSLLAANSCRKDPLLQWCHCGGLSIVLGLSLMGMQPSSLGDRRCSSNYHGIRENPKVSLISLESKYQEIRVYTVRYFVLREPAKVKHVVRIGELGTNRNDMFMTVELKTSTM